jgi:hypothetical protein
MFSLLPNEALDGELEDGWADFRGDCLLTPAFGGFRMIFRRVAAFLSGRSGDDFFKVDELFIDGIGASSWDSTGSWYICSGCCA